MQPVLDNIIATAGANWVYAVAASFFAMIMESARPKAEEGRHDNLTGARFLAMVAGTLTPFLLLGHIIGSAAMQEMTSPIALALQALSDGNWTTGAGAALLSGAAAVLVSVAIASTLGLVIASAAPALGRMLQTPAPFVSIAVFAFTAYVTWQTVFWIAQHPTVIIVYR